jgi:molybdenum cofactor cytidylyltransferase
VISGIVLAAGKSSRLGRPKQLLQLEGRPMLQHVVDVAHEARLDEIVVVLGHREDAVAAALRLPEEARTVGNPEYASGQSASLRAGLDALHPSSECAVILLGDQPRVPAEAIRTVVQAFRSTPAQIVRAMYGGVPGHPVLLGREVWEAVRRIGGDVGARDVIAGRAGDVLDVEVGDSPPADIDTWEEYERIRQIAEGRVT